MNLMKLVIQGVYKNEVSIFKICIKTYMTLKKKDGTCLQKLVSFVFNEIVINKGEEWWI